MTRLAASFRVRGAALLAAACLLSAAPAAAQHQHTAGGAAGVPELGASRTEPWDGDVLQLAATLPVQDGGRVKPLSTKAGFLLLRMNGKRSVKTPDGERLGPTAWLLDSLLFPQQAAGYPVFLIQNDAVLDAIGIAHEGKGKRDRYAYSDLQPGRRKRTTWPANTPGPSRRTGAPSSSS